MKKGFKAVTIILMVLMSVSACNSKEDTSLNISDSLKGVDSQNTSDNSDYVTEENKSKNAVNTVKMSDYGIISDDVRVDFVLEVDIDKPIKNINKIFDGGGQKVETGNIVRYLYAEKEVRTLTTDAGTSICYLSTKNIKDKTIRGIGVGDSSDELLKAYPEDRLILQETWDSVVSAEYDAAYKLVADDERRQTVFLLNEDAIIMIQIADMQNKDNNSFDWDFVK